MKGGKERRRGREHSKGTEHSPYDDHRSHNVPIETYATGLPIESASVQRDVMVAHTVSVRVSVCVCVSDGRSEMT